MHDPWMDDSAEPSGCAGILVARVLVGVAVVVAVAVAR
jgi:hypothetical protein